MDSEITRLAIIGRPGIGGEFLEVRPTIYGRYQLRRMRRINTQRDEPRVMDVDDLHGSAMVYDLLGAIERILEHSSETTDYGIDLDDKGIDGQQPSMRDRLYHIIQEY